MNNQERQALIRQLRDSISDLTAYVNMKPEPKDAEDYRWTIKVQEIALAALTENWQQRAGNAEAECVRLNREAQNLSDQLGACDRERRALRAQLAELEQEQSEHDQQIATLQGKFDLALAGLRSKTARCEKVEAQLAAPLVVKAPEFKVHAQHPTMAAGMRDNDWKEAIKAAGGSVADE
ncbi:hypothetical protein [Mixta sp. Marseille-Q2659]|uniref:hypothetical protein n=1 Tax=Mixta sp. Marseille-Q2659 TaxID=2736607 RepID=UPI0023B9EAF9|nr:hypothetical protein [Mixta sp. Marseille-Q2659]